ncbi:MAG: Y-family DNA polymerase [Thiotrichales bacterium]
MLWLALYFPDFPLQATLGAVQQEPAVLVETRAGRQVIVAVNELASSAGIERGMTLAAAQPLVTTLQFMERQPRQEQIALEQLAQWAQQFTALVSLQPPGGLLLDIQASLKLFGGLEALQQQIALALQPLSYRAIQSVACTAEAAWVLARAGASQPCETLPVQRRRIAALPLSSLLANADVLSALESTGVRTIGDCLALPRKALARRFGAELVNQLDRMLGQAPDPRVFYQPPDQFYSQILLPDVVRDSQALLFALQRLLHELAGFLRARDAGAQEMRLGLIAPQQPVESLELRLLSPTHDPLHLYKLWQEKLEKHALSGWVEGIELEVRTLVSVETEALDLFASAKPSGPSFIHFLERLQNRLGDQVIQQAFCCQEHRPELAGKLRGFDPEKKSASPTNSMSAARPLWLLPQPQEIKTTEQGPWIEGPLELLEGPERIESGWWDGDDQRRDYYVARTLQQQTLWIYQDIRAGARWFLQGYFD